MQKPNILAAAALLTLLVITFSACGKVSSSDTLKDAQANIFQSVTTDEVNPLIEQTQGLVILDVRTPVEYASGHLENAVNIDFESPDFSQKISQLNKNAAYLVYCRSGNRSGKAVKIMQEAGFMKLYNMEGGINKWLAGGGKVVR
jgi:rhodanese-related sulfurtransferase